MPARGAKSTARPKVTAASARGGASKKNPNSNSTTKLKSPGVPKSAAAVSTNTTTAKTKAKSLKAPSSTLRSKISPKTARSKASTATRKSNDKDKSAKSTKSSPKTTVTNTVTKSSSSSSSNKPNKNSSKSSPKSNKNNKKFSKSSKSDKETQSRATSSFGNSASNVSVFRLHTPPESGDESSAHNYSLIPAQIQRLADLDSDEDDSHCQAQGQRTPASGKKNKSPASGKKSDEESSDATHQSQKSGATTTTFMRRILNNITNSEEKFNLPKSGERVTSSSYRGNRNSKEDEEAKGNEGDDEDGPLSKSKKGVLNPMKKKTSSNSKSSTSRENLSKSGATAAMKTATSVTARSSTPAKSKTDSQKTSTHPTDSEIKIQTEKNTIANSRKLSSMKKFVDKIQNSSQAKAISSAAAAAAGKGASPPPTLKSVLSNTAPIVINTQSDPESSEFDEDQEDDLLNPKCDPAYRSAKLKRQEQRRIKAAQAKAISKIKNIDDKSPLNSKDTLTSPSNSKPVLAGPGPGRGSSNSPRGPDGKFIKKTAQNSAKGTTVTAMSSSSNKLLNSGTSAAGNTTATRVPSSRPTKSSVTTSSGTIDHGSLRFNKALGFGPNNEVLKKKVQAIEKDLALTGINVDLDVDLDPERISAKNYLNVNSSSNLNLNAAAASSSSSSSKNPNLNNLNLNNLNSTTGKKVFTDHITDKIFSQAIGVDLSTIDENAEHRPPDDPLGLNNMDGLREDLEKGLDLGFVHPDDLAMFDMEGTKFEPRKDLGGGLNGGLNLNLNQDSEVEEPVYDSEENLDAGSDDFNFLDLDNYEVDLNGNRVLKKGVNLNLLKKGGIGGASSVTGLNRGPIGGGLTGRPSETKSSSNLKHQQNLQPESLFDTILHENYSSSKNGLMEVNPGFNPSLAQRYKDQKQQVCGRSRLISTKRGIQRTRKMDVQIRKAQSSSDSKPMISGALFRRLVRDCGDVMGFARPSLNDNTSSNSSKIPGKKWTRGALALIQRLAEEVSVIRLAACLVLATHAKRVTLKDIDMASLKRIKAVLRKDLKMRSEM